MLTVKRQLRGMDLAVYHRLPLPTSRRSRLLPLGRRADCELEAGESPTQYLLPPIQQLSHLLRCEPAAVDAQSWKRVDLLAFSYAVVVKRTHVETGDDALELLAQVLQCSMTTVPALAG